MRRAFTFEAGELRLATMPTAMIRTRFNTGGIMPDILNPTNCTNNAVRIAQQARISASIANGTAAFQKLCRVIHYLIFSAR